MHVHLKRASRVTCTCTCIPLASTTPFLRRLLAEGMALWRYVMETPDGGREANVLAAGNREAATARAERNAAARGATLVEGPTLLDSTRGSM